MLVSPSGLPPDLTRPSHEVGPLLLGCHLTSTTPDGVVTVVITEVEAYSGADDPASHAFRGPTARNEVMFGPAGHAYVYLSHGVHWCLNIVTGVEGSASGVLLRAGRVVEGHDLARARRGPTTAERSLARGPGCLGRALGVTGADSGTSVLHGPRLQVRDRVGVPPAIVAGPRVGVSQAPDVPWRFWIQNDPSVSLYRRSPRAVPTTTPRS